MSFSRFNQFFIGVGVWLFSSFAPLQAEETLLRNSLGMTFVSIPAGAFTMGTTDLDDVVFELPSGDVSQIKDETPAHQVIIGKGFYLGQTEVTQQQWLAVMGSKPGPASHWTRQDWQTLPVVSVSWFDAQAFIKALNQRELDKTYRLPTEAEWEYAARAGSTDVRPFELEALDQYAWYIRNSGDEPQPVARLKPNAWNLYDTLGNAWEWVNDNYAPDSYQHHARQDPQGVERGEKKVRRGGSYHCQPHLVRPAFRAVDKPETAYTVTGFRVLLEK
jgi:sulfatase modifying factor 1